MSVFCEGENDETAEWVHCLPPREQPDRVPLAISTLGPWGAVDWVCVLASLGISRVGGADWWGPFLLLLHPQDG